MGWVEDRAAAAREATRGDLAQLELLREALVVAVPAPGPVGLCVHRDNDRCLLLLPRDRQRAAHEWGHADCHVGLAEQYRRDGNPLWRIQLWREEAQADRWAAEFLREDE